MESNVTFNFVVLPKKYYISQHPPVVRRRRAVVRTRIENHHKTLLQRLRVEVSAAILGGEVGC